MKIFCVGIGGIGLSGVAQILRSQGHLVSGSDASPSELTESLRISGIEVFEKHSTDNIDSSTDLLIYSEAVPEENPERDCARQLGIRQINYAKALGMVSDKKLTIAITGTHGKTTVTGMVTSILLEAEKDPTIIIGSKMDLLNGQNYRVGNSELFLCEACEYRDNFLELNPNIVLVNNLDPDHLDYFGSAERYYNSFQKLIEKIPPSGTLVLFEEDRGKLKLDQVKATIKILSKESFDESYNLQVPGKHNQQNAFAAQAVAEVLGVPLPLIKKGLELFHGTWRRFEYKGTINGGKVYDDYGHHPTEIRATIQAAREWFPEKNLTIIFQPHQYSRTRQFFDEFVSSFEGADDVWITDIYKARDSNEDIAETSAEKLSSAISTLQSSKYVPLSEIPHLLKQSSNDNQIYLIMGAGNIHGVFQHLVFDPRED